MSVLGVPAGNYFNLLHCEKFSRFWTVVSCHDVILWNIPVNLAISFSYLIELSILNYFNLEVLYLLFFRVGML